MIALGCTLVAEWQSYDRALQNALREKAPPPSWHKETPGPIQGTVFVPGVSIGRHDRLSKAAEQDLRD